jgi:hypothetical protein
MSAGGLPFADVETAYELLARSIDVAGEENEALFLARLALLMAEKTGDIGLFEAAVREALAGLPQAAAAPDAG